MVELHVGVEQGALVGQEGALLALEPSLGIHVKWTLDIKQTPHWQRYLDNWNIHCRMKKEKKSGKIAYETARLINYRL